MCWWRRRGSGPCDPGFLRTEKERAREERSEARGIGGVPADLRREQCLEIMELERVRENTKKIAVLPTQRR